jgi:hypothetical protein
MTVTLVVSETVNGAEVSDGLSGGDTGLSYGQVVNGSYCPVVSQAANTGQQDLYLFHDGVQPITDVKLYIDVYSGTYGGADTAGNDYALLGSLGASDAGATGNNLDGLSRGLHVDMSWNVSAATQFYYAREGTGQKRIFGKSYSGLDGLGSTTAFDLHVDAMSYWNGSTEVDASGPVTGTIGGSADTGTYGNRGHIKTRFYLHSGATQGGVFQWDTVINYAFTS